MGLRIKVLDKLEYLCFILIYVLMADCCLFGAGRFVEIGSVGFRMIVFALVLVTALPSMLRNTKSMMNNRLIQMVLVFLVWLVICAVRGFVANNSRTHIMSDLKGFAYLAFLPVVLSVVNTKNRLHKLMKVMMYSAAVLAVGGLISLVAYIWFPDSAFLVIMDLFAAKDGNSYGVAAYTAISDKILRVFFYSGLYLICGCAFSIYYQMRNPGRFCWGYAVITGLCLFALLLTFTRSVYLAVAVAALAIMVVFLVKTTKEEKERLLAQIAASVLLVVILLAVFGVSTGSNYFGYALSRVGVTFAGGEKEPVISSEEYNQPETETIAPSDEIVPDTSSKEDNPTGEKSEGNSYNEVTVASDELRAVTVVELIENIKKSPVIGNGLGVTLECRDDGYNEYFYLDMMAKTGIIGLFLYMMPLIYMVVKLVADRTMKKDEKQLVGVWIASLLGFCTYSYFNPYMNAALGVLYYCCTMGVFRCCRNEDMR